MKHQQEIIDINTPLDFNREKIKIRNYFIISSILSLINQLLLIAFIVVVVILTELHNGDLSPLILLVFWVPVNVLFGMFTRRSIKDVESILKALSWQYDIKDEPIALFNTARFFIFSPFSLVASICFIVLYVKWNYITVTSKTDNNIKIKDAIVKNNEILSNETNEDMFNSWKPND